MSYILVGIACLVAGFSIGFTFAAILATKNL
jgi:hypothetical protein